MWVRNRRLSAFAAAIYVLALSTVALFHSHAGHASRAHNASIHSDRCCTSGGRSHEADDHDVATSGCEDHSRHSSPSGTNGPNCVDDECPVCQFLVQKPVPVQDVAPVASPERVSHVAAVPSAAAAAALFAAWHSRAPPVLA